MARESTIGSIFKMETMPQVATTPATAPTKAVMAVITTVGATLVKGDYIVIAGTGFKALDRLTAHRVFLATATSITVETDTTAETATATAGTMRKVTLVETCFSEFGNEASAPGEVDVTTMCDLERRNVAGLSTPGSATFSGPLDLSDAGQKEMIKAQKDGLTRNLIWTTRGGQQGFMAGVVSSWAASPQGVEQAVTFNGSFQIKEAPVYLNTQA